MQSGCGPFPDATCRTPANIDESTGALEIGSDDGDHDIERDGDPDDEALGSTLGDLDGAELGAGDSVEVGAAADACFNGNDNRDDEGEQDLVFGVKAAGVQTISVQSKFWQLVFSFDKQWKRVLW